MERESTVKGKKEDCKVFLQSDFSIEYLKSIRNQELDEKRYKRNL